MCIRVENPWIKLLIQVVETNLVQSLMARPWLRAGLYVFILSVTFRETYHWSGSIESTPTNGRG